MQIFALGILAGLCLLISMAFIAGAVQAVVGGYRGAQLVLDRNCPPGSPTSPYIVKMRRGEIAGGWLGAFMMLLIALFWVAIGMLIGSAA